MVKKITVLLFVFSFSTILLAQTKKPQVKPKAVVSSAGAAKASITRGKAVYNTYCGVCHQADGGGISNMHPPLIKTSYVLGAKTPLINIVLQGLEGVDIDGESYQNAMPAHNFLTDHQVADVLTYVRNSFGNKASTVTAAEVKVVRAKK